MAMSERKIVEVLTRYREHLLLHNTGAEPNRHIGELPEEDEPFHEAVVDHLLHCIDGALELAKDPARREKLMRWLGFIQGALWYSGLYTVEELMQHNMPDPDEMS
jgi:hypothetical protein